MNALAMCKPASHHLSTFLLGGLFAIGLAVSGMTQPGKVIGFLDFFGDWDPALLGVMGAGIVVYALFFRLVGKAGTPLLASRFSLPTRRDVDLKLLLGAVLFGAGWGLGGYCPGPAITSIVTGDARLIVFVGFMAVGMFLERNIAQRSSR